MDHPAGTDHGVGRSDSTELVPRASDTERPAQPGPADSGGESFRELSAQV